MIGTTETRCTAFEGHSRVASGELADVARKAKEVVDGVGRRPVLIFDDATSELIEVDFRGSADDVVKRLARSNGDNPPEAGPEPHRGPGRPRLGVMAREVTLLPRHWEWLNGQPGGASVALRKLVEDARRGNAAKDRFRQAREAAYRFMSAVAGDLPGFEEATRALFAGAAARFDEHTATWPADVRDHARRLAAVAFDGEGAA